MCGINGVYRFSGQSYPKDLILKMNNTIAHRGPNAEGEFHDKYVQLGHRRLSIIDTDSRSNQPFKSEDNRYILVFNGEIYNYKTLKTHLQDYTFKTDSDTEVVLASYIKWGEQCVKHFNGMFAFSIWDSIEQSMFIARDRLGIKPLYYNLDHDRIVFSSSVKAILNSDLVPRVLYREGVVDYLRFQTVHAPYTIIENVFSLMPGQYMVLNDERQDLKTYWSQTENYQTVKPDKTEIISNIQNKLGEAVNNRLMSDVPFGAFLSGGIDSSIIVALMAESKRQAVDTFSVVFKEEEFSEGKYAKEVADRYKTNHHEIELTANHFKDLIPEALNFLDHPSGDGLNTFVVSKYTKEAGVTMALSGLGGDELFGGYSIFNQVPNLQAKKWLNSFPNYARKQIGNAYHAFKRSVPSGKVKALMKQAYFDTEYIHQFYRQVLMDNQIAGLLKLENLPLNKSFEIANELIGYRSKGWSLPPLSRISVAEMSTYMQNVLLRDSDQMSMAHALEVRVPFLDHHLVEYVLGIPDAIKKPITPKALLVESFKSKLPKSVYNRDKMGFVLPYDQWMRSELKSFCEINLNHLKKVSIFKDSAIDKLWSQFLKNDKRVTWSRIWPLVVLGNWIELNNING
ncbi:MAG: asparagine synthase (glutamine-hydrolyzing) [Crocinitomicaceae bacterium]